MKIRVSVKDIVELVYGSGDLISEGSLFKRAEEGTKIHQLYQADYQANDEAESYIDYEEITEDYTLNISGRIDGVLKRNGQIVIEEIKSTTKELSTLDETVTPAHLAQAKFYAYFYMLKNKKRKIKVRLTYIHVNYLNIKTEKYLKHLDFDYTFSDLRNFFTETIVIYLDWIKTIDQHEESRNVSIEGLTFPFESYRTGQRELMAACYKTILKNDILYAIAPTGVGKTIATVFSALKAINSSEQKIFYLTAKNSGKKVALDTVSLLIDKGLIIKTIEITSKDHICVSDDRNCEECPLAAGYFERIFGAIKDIYHNHSLFTKELITEYAEKHMVCPFEFSLDLSYYADIIICDYNYAFCPLTHLTRYFDESEYLPILLCDEAHNLVGRSKDMYSAKISKINILYLVKLLRENNTSFPRIVGSLVSQFEEFDQLLGEAEYQVIEKNTSFIDNVHRLFKRIDEFLTDEKNIINRSEIVKIMLDLLRFNKISDFFDDDFIFSLERVKDDLVVNISCLDASKFILKTIEEKTIGSILFSATLHPLHYYKQMLTKNVGNQVEIESPFNQHHLKLITLASVSTRYKDRPQSIEKICDTIRILGNSKKGNYIVFFPSYQYLQMVYQELEKKNYHFDFIVQKSDFTLEDREDVINLFKQNDKTQIGLFVMGGVFAEGIDYIGDMLSGVIIVGTGLPMVGGYNNVVKDHFDQHFGSGFDFAYTYPGFSKVVQAVGRVIRSESDYGVAILIDDRFASLKYQRLYPREWSHMIFIKDLYQLSEEINDFWDLRKE